MNSLPVEVITSILKHINFDENHECERPSSSAYWSCPLQTQAALWGNRIAADRTAWNLGVGLRTVSRRFNESMSTRMSQSVVTLARPTNNSFVPRSHLSTSPSKRVKIYSDSGCSWALEFLKSNSATIQSFFVEMGLAPSMSQWMHRLPRLDLQSTAFPHLTAFTFRTNAASEWLRFDTLAELLRNSPNLKHLTVFQLAGSQHDGEDMEVLQHQGEPACRLVSLHVRRTWQLHLEDLEFMVAKSHESLRQLTWVFEKYVTSSHPMEFAEAGRQCQAKVFYHAFKPCTRIETLRIADLVRDLVLVEEQRREAVNWRSYMGGVLDRMMLSLQDLQHLEVCGTIQMRLLHARDLNVLPFHLKSLFIDRHLGYRLGNLILQLDREEGPLSRLERLAIDEQVEVNCSTEQWQAMQRLCERRGVEFRIHRDDLSQN